MKSGTQSGQMKRRRLMPARPVEVESPWRQSPAPGSFWPRPLIFLHIPKAAGSSLQEWIVRHYPGANMFRFLGDRAQRERFAALPEEERGRFDVILGHVNFGVHELLPEPATYLTMLRDPVDRVVSHYYYVLSTPSHYLHKRVAGRGYSLLEFVLTRVSHELDNDQVRWLSSKHHDEIPVGGIDRRVLDEAKWNLEHGIAAVGLMERYSESLECFRRTFSWEHIPTQTFRNVNNDRPALSEVPREAIEAIREVNRADVELYEFAEALFEEQMNRLGVGSDSAAPPQ